MSTTKVTRNMLDTGIADSSNATAITIDSSENVGIGTSSPSDLLHVKGSSSANVLIDAATDNATLTLQAGSSDSGAEGAFAVFIQNTTNKWQLGMDTDNDFRLYNYAASEEALAIDSSSDITISGKITSNANGTGGTKATLADFTSSGSIRSILLKGAENTANQVFLDVVKDINGTETTLFSIADTNVGIGTTSPAQLLHVETTASPIATFRYNSSNRVDIRYDGLDTYGGNFRMMLAGSEQFRFGTTGVLGVSTTTLKSAGDNPTDENSTVIGPGYLYLQRDDSASINQIIFGKDGQTVGNIITTTATSYVSASDYRMKENVDYTWDATSRLKQLKPARYNWIADETNTLEDGFLAHEVATVVPNAVFGEKDAVDSDGNPEMQGVDSSKLIPLLVKTIQELEARITTLES